MKCGTHKVNYWTYHNRNHRVTGEQVVKMWHGDRHRRMIRGQPTSNTINMLVTETDGEYKHTGSPLSPFFPSAPFKKTYCKYLQIRWFFSSGDTQNKWNCLRWGCPILFWKGCSPVGFSAICALLTAGYPDQGWNPHRSSLDTPCLRVLQTTYWCPSIPRISFISCIAWSPW